MKNNFSQAAIFLILLLILSLAGFAQEPEGAAPPGEDASEIEALQGADIVIGLEAQEPEPPAVNVPLPVSVTPQFKNMLSRNRSISEGFATSLILAVGPCTPPMPSALYP